VLVAFDSLGSNGGGKVVEDVVHLLHGLHLQHEAGNLAPPHLHHTCRKHSQIGPTSSHNATPINVSNSSALAWKLRLEAPCWMSLHWAAGTWHLSEACLSVKSWAQQTKVMPARWASAAFWHCCPCCLAHDFMHAARLSSRLS